MAKQYTVVLVQHDQRVTLINRANPPYIGLWNGLGGKIEPGETPRQGAIREVQEECGVAIAAVDMHARGLVHWVVDGEFRGELFLFLATATTAVPLQQNREGVIATWPMSWVTTTANAGLVPDLQALLPYFWQHGEPTLVSYFEGERFIRLEEVPR